MRFLIVTLLAVMPLQAADNPIVSKLLDHWSKSQDYMIELANQMPAEQYTSRPNSKEMTYGEQMIHIANAILFFTKAWAPAQTPMFDQKKTDKDTALAALNTAFNAGGAAIATLSDVDLGTKILDSGEGKMTALEVVMLMVDHTEHHRGQAIVYLRHEGIKPVDYRF
jgi:uncharacterized damage-inducible protein DinB